MPAPTTSTRLMTFSWLVYLPDPVSPKALGSNSMVTEPPVTIMGGSCWLDIFTPPDRRGHDFERGAYCICAKRSKRFRAGVSAGAMSRGRTLMAKRKFAVRRGAEEGPRAPLSSRLAVVEPRPETGEAFALPLPRLVRVA